MNENYQTDDNVAISGGLKQFSNVVLIAWLVVGIRADYLTRDLGL